jgi:hypothetical protein
VVLVAVVNIEVVLNIDGFAVVCTGDDLTYTLIGGDPKAARRWRYGWLRGPIWNPKTRSAG